MMAQNEQNASTIFRLVLGKREERASDALSAGEWDVLQQIALANVALIRLSDALEKTAASASVHVLEAANAERAKISQAIGLMGRVSALCVEHGIPYMFPKAFQHYPDMGHDIDLLVLDRSRKVDDLLTRELGAEPEHDTLFNRIANKTGYNVPGYGAPLEVHHARLGHAGEYNTYPATLMERAKQVSMEGVTSIAPSPEDQLIVQAIQRVCAHFTVRLGDAIDSVLLLKSHNLDWDYVAKTTMRLGAFQAMGCYLAYVDQIHRSLAQESILPNAVSQMFPSNGCGKVTFQGLHYQIPAFVITSKIYPRKLVADLAARNWEGLGKTAIQLPVPFLVSLRRRIMAVA
jgi:hypothetical protein